MKFDLHVNATAGAPFCAASGSRYASGRSAVRGQLREAFEIECPGAAVRTPRYDFRLGGPGTSHVRAGLLVHASVLQAPRRPVGAFRRKLGMRRRPAAAHQRLVVSSLSPVARHTAQDSKPVLPVCRVLQSVGTTRNGRNNSGLDRPTRPAPSSSAHGSPGATQCPSAPRQFFPDRPAYNPDWGLIGMESKYSRCK
jgi:hypothetical protein